MCLRAAETGRDTELVFVVGGPADATYETIAREMANYPQRRCALLRQNGQGRGDAVRLGFSQAGGEIFMFPDGDLTVPPEDLPRSFRAPLEGKGEFINGVRLVYPMQQQTMRPANLFGNKLFSRASAETGFLWPTGLSSPASSRRRSRILFADVRIHRPHRHEATARSPRPRLSAGRRPDSPASLTDSAL